ncbi:MAG TPA: heme ABC exporter ATP-binding protein CcmA [Methylibium sp.]|uniref:heme ABC exporter ATP-binding protein CcmA n=1 Tax=Methylibium sp. TaxID=2067992 RepID=UPI002DBAFE6D|nr:heme ABC exporter ATP-binding protein CcmA [Methylibium sp.]HEU4457873.1 heme ABC exporter ATP-binding protein CcmA [Methylibium sp.]
MTTPPTTAATSASPPLARVRGLSVRRERQRLFRALDFDLPRGRALWIRGRNGSGKTTLLRVLAGLRKPDEGGVDWSGRRPLFIGHANALKDDLTVLESLRFAARLHRHRGDAASLEAALARLKLDARRDQPVRQLSQGLRRRVALARLALADEAEAWLLDEPHDALDDDSSATLDALIGEQLARGGAVALTHHGQVRLAAERLDTLVLDRASGAP